MVRRRAPTRAALEEARRRCLEAAARAYEEGGMSGLCAEGRWELALEAIRGVELGDLDEEE